MINKQTITYSLKVSIKVINILGLYSRYQLVKTELRKRPLPNKTQKNIFADTIFRKSKSHEILFLGLLHKYEYLRKMLMELIKN